MFVVSMRIKSQVIVYFLLLTNYYLLGYAFKLILFNTIVIRTRKQCPLSIKRICHCSMCTLLGGNRKRGIEQNIWFPLSNYIFSLDASDLDHAE